MKDLLLFLLFAYSPLMATSSFWLGGSSGNNMTDPDNWLGGVVPDEIAIFKQGTLTPQLVGASLSFDTFLFPSQAPNNGYTITLNSPSILTFEGVGVQLDNIQQQTFNVNNAVLNFTINASASTGYASPPANYNIMSGSNVFFTENGSAGNALFNANGANFFFYGNSNAENAQIQLVNSETRFFDNSSAASALISQTGGETSFNDNSTAEEATIFVSADGLLRFQDQANMGSSTITASDSAIIRYNSLTSDSTAHVSLLGNANLDMTSGRDLTLATLSGDGLVSIKSAELQVGASNSSSTFEGEIFGASDIFSKIGSGTFIFNGIANNVNINVEGGTYILNGQVTESEVFVDEAAVLSGTGTIGVGSLYVAGNLIPGSPNGVGTLTLVTASPFYQMVGSTFTANVNGLGESSRLDVLGSFANIQANSTFTVATPDNSMLIGSQYRYHVLHADQGIYGTYQTVNSLNPFLAPHLIYETFNPPTDIYLTLSTNFSPFATTENEACVAAFFDELSLGEIDDDAEEVLVALASIPTTGGLTTALNKITGEQYTYLGQLSQYADYRFGRRLFSTVRNLILPTKCCYAPQCNYVNSWVQLEYNYANVVENKKVRGLHDNSWDISAGGHYFMSPKFLFGGALDYGQDYVRFDRDKSNNCLQTVQGAIYALYNHTDLYFFSNLIVGETWSNRFERNLRFDSIDRKTKSNPSLFHGKYYLEVGCEFDVACGLFEPFFGVDVGWYNLNKISEHGANVLDRTIYKKDRAYGDTLLGFHLLECAGNGLSFSGDLYWQHRFRTFNSENLCVGFRSFDTLCCVEGNQFYEDGVVGSLNVSTCMNNWDLYLEINGERWGRFNSYGATLGVATWW